MLSEDSYIGCTNEIERLRVLNDKLNAMVLEQVNDSQELVMMNSFSQESSEYLFKKCMQDRLSDIASWRWVLEDLMKRLTEAIEALKYEHNALRVVVRRIEDEIDEHSQDATRPGALNPLSDSVEEAILEEFRFLHEQKTKFTKMILELEKQTVALEKTKQRIVKDILNKEEAISIEEACIAISINSANKSASHNRKKKRGSALIKWEKKCAQLKRAGLRALNNGVIIRQQVRGARVQLSILAQSYATKVDSALKRRLHSNTFKLDELKWQKQEAMQDFTSLDKELTATEQNLIETMEQESVIEARLADRALRPAGELTKDDVDKKLRDEQGRLKQFCKHLRNNIERISDLQNNLTDAMARVDCCVEDLMQVVRLDENRIRARLGENTKCDSETSPTDAPTKSPILPTTSNTNGSNSSNTYLKSELTSIREEEGDDYPFDS